MIGEHSFLTSDLFLELFDEEDRHTKVLRFDESGFLCVISEDTKLLKKSIQVATSLGDISGYSYTGLMYEIVRGLGKLESSGKFILLYIATKINKLLYYALGTTNILIKDINSNLVEIKATQTYFSSKDEFIKNIKSYPLENISTMFSATSTLAELLFKKSYEDAFSKKDILQTLKNLGSELLEDSRFAFLFLNNHIGRELDTRTKFDINPSIDEIATAEENIELLLESYFKGNNQNAKTLIVVNELLMNAYEHGILKIDSQTKNRYLSQGNYDELLKKLEKDTKGKIRIEVFIYKEGVLQISIDDFGEGFSEELIREYDKTQYRGRGIILSKKLTDALFFTNNGSKVSFFINYKLKKEKPPLPPNITEEDILKQSKILYVEDNKVTRSIFEKSLKKLVKEVYVAEDGREGFELFQDVNPDIVISDICMPQMNGIDMIRHIRSIDKEVPILLTTAQDADSSIIEAISVGVDRFIPKPLNIDRLKEVLNLFAKTIYYNKKQDEVIRSADIRSQVSYLESQQKLARDKQNLIIRDDREKIKELEIEVFHKPIDILSGDIYGIYKIDESRSALFVADCMGKGLVASVTSVLAAAFLDRAFSVGASSSNFTFERTCQNLIDFIQKYLLPEEIISLFIVLFDFKKGEMIYASYGMYPMCIKPDDNKECILLKSTNPPLMRGENCLNTATLDIPKSFKMLIYTDGACELSSFDYKLLLKKFSSANDKESFIETYKKEVLHHFDKPEDDITLVCIKKVAL